MIFLNALCFGLMNLKFYISTTRCSVQFHDKVVQFLSSEEYDNTTRVVGSHPFLIKLTDLTCVLILKIGSKQKFILICKIIQFIGSLIRAVRRIHLKYKEAAVFKLFENLYSNNSAQKNVKRLVVRVIRHDVFNFLLQERRCFGSQASSFCASSQRQFNTK